MKKTLVAIAALAAFGAQAQSSVTLSGNVDVSYGVKEVSSATGAKLHKASGIAEGQNGANRITFAATEDLGGGMKGGALFETGMNITNGALLSSRAAAGGVNVVGVSAAGEIPSGAYGLATNRQSYVTLSGGMGEIRGGFQYTNLYRLSTLSGYMVGQEQYGSLLHTIGNASFGGARANGLSYISPNYKGFTATVQQGSGADREDYSTSTAAGTNGYTGVKQSRTGVLVDYANGPLKASWAHTNYTEKKTAGTTTTVVDIYGVTSATAAASTDFKGTLNQLGASYEFGALKVAGTYNNGKKDNATGDDVTYKSHNIGGIYTVGKVGFFASTGSGEVKTAATLTNDIAQSQYGVRYAFGKRTTAYVMHGESKDKAQTSATATAKATVTAFGLAHSF